MSEETFNHKVAVWERWLVWFGRRSSVDHVAERAVKFWRAEGDGDGL